MNFDKLNALEENNASTTSNKWLLSLADLISLILTFFVMIYSTKEMPQEQYDKITSSFKNYIQGEKNTEKYKFQKKLDDNNASSKQPSGLTYVENIINRTFEEDTSLRLSVKKETNQLTIAFEPENLVSAPSKELIAVAKIINTLNNQIEISTISDSKKSSLEITNKTSDQLKELGYDLSIIRSLPKENFYTDSLEKNKNKLKILISIKAYETIF
jgi:hypothetical protein